MINKLDQKEKYDWSRGLVLFFRLSGWIVFPILAAALIGKKMDRSYGTEPWIFLSAVGVAFVVSIFGMVSLSLDEFRKADQKNNKIK